MHNKVNVYVSAGILRRTAKGHVGELELGERCEQSDVIRDCATKMIPVESELLQRWRERCEYSQYLRQRWPCACDSLLKCCRLGGLNMPHPTSSNSQS